MVILVIVIGLCILLVQGTRRIPVQYKKRVVGNKQYGGVRQFIPLKVNAAGVIFNNLYLRNYVCSSNT